MSPGVDWAPHPDSPFDLELQNFCRDIGVLYFSPPLLFPVVLLFLVIDYEEVIGVLLPNPDTY